MSIATYSFYLESEAGVPARDMNPEISLIKSLPDGINLSEDFILNINNHLKDVGDGVYTFPFDWESWEQSITEGNNSFVNLDEYSADIKRSLFIKIKTNFETQDQAYISMRIERQDILPELVDRVQGSAESLISSSDSLKAIVEKILSIEEGSWIVRNNKFLVFSKETTYQQMTDDNAIYSFDLKDASSNPTSENPFQRIVSGL